MRFLLYFCKHLIVNTVQGLGCWELLLPCPQHLHISAASGRMYPPTGPPVNGSHRSYAEGSRSSFQRKTNATVLLASMGVYIESMAARAG